MLSTLTRTAKLGVAALLLLLTFRVSVKAADAPATSNNDGFVQLFNGKDLTGWQLVGGVGPGYVVKDGVIVCPADGGGNLYTDKEYSDFIFRFEFKLSPNGNNGIGLRAPLQGDAAYVGMEAQILDDTSPEYAHLEPGQYHSSIYKVVPAKRGSLKPVGEWNQEEIVALGRHIKITVNGMVTVDANLNDVTDPNILAQHPGFRRDQGFVGFLGHGPSEVQFRNIFIKDLTLIPVPDQQQPQKRGFFARLFGHHHKQPQTFHYVPRVQLDDTPPEG
ncbi:MAG: DUF1080 domain-containing protein, partial [Abitibacteriaceae bacterium]|nr:DUF1080 domain-containing protein [Abditibacteriaceae bacterium]